MKYLNVLACSGLLISLGACGGLDLDGAHYWQRASMSDAAYQQGPAAQTMLNRDIAHCVSTLRELENTDSLRAAIPADAGVQPMSADEQRLAGWDTPGHDGALLTEHTDYHDFEGCMKAGGWERARTLPYDVAENARRNYFLAHVDYGYDPETEKPGGINQRSYSNLND